MYIRSCVHKLLFFLSQVFSALNSRARMDVIFLDLWKAFDSVNHDTLLLKNSMLGITGPLLQWLHCYLFGIEHTLQKCLSTLVALAVSKSDQASLKVAF